MAWTRFSLRSRAKTASKKRERGATLTEYAFLGSLVVVASLGAITLLEDESGSYLVDTGSDIGVPRAFAADIDPDLPDSPPWLTVPPPPSTLPPPPAGTPVYQGSIRGLNSTSNCYEVDSPATNDSVTNREPCDASTTQNLEMYGTLTVIDEIIWVDNPGYCLTSDTASSNRAVLKTCDGTDSQRWDVTDNGGNLTFESRDRPGKCIRSTGEGLKIRDCNTNDNTKFFVP